MSPRLTIIIPVFNAEAYLEECLASVVGQAFGDIEVICVNDGSTDKSLSILEEWAGKDNRIHIVTQTNSGPSAARNKGLDAAQGDYVTFVDADDIVRNDIYSSSLSVISRYNLDVYSFGIESYPNGSARKTSFPIGIVMDYKQLFASNPHIQSENALCYSVRFIFRTSIIKDNHLQFDERIFFGEDMLFNIDVVCHSQRMMVSQEPLYLYRKNENSAMAKPFKPHLEDSLVRAYDLKKEQIEKYHLDEDCNYREDIAEYYIKEFLPMLINNEIHRPEPKELKASVKRILSLKMFRESFDIIGFRNIYSSIGAYGFYLVQKFRLHSLVLSIYKKQLRGKR